MGWNGLRAPLAVVGGGLAFGRVACGGIGARLPLSRFDNSATITP